MLSLIILLLSSPFVTSDSIFVGTLNNTVQPSKLTLTDLRDPNKVADTVYFPRSDIHSGFVFAFRTSLAPHQSFKLQDFLTARVDEGMLWSPVATDGCALYYVLDIRTPSSVHVVSGPGAAVEIVGSGGLRMNRYGPDYTQLYSDPNGLLKITARVDEPWPGACTPGTGGRDTGVFSGSYSMTLPSYEGNDIIDHHFDDDGLPALVVWTTKEPKDLVITPPTGHANLFIANNNQVPQVQTIFV